MRKRLEGDYLINAQGEDVVAGIRATYPVEQMAETMPQAWSQFVEIANKLEQHYRDMQDVEFTVERATLWMLQTRNGKRTAQAAVRIAADMADRRVDNPGGSRNACHSRAGGLLPASAV